MGGSLQLQRRIRREIGSLLPAGFLRGLYRRSALHTAATLAHVWLAIGAGLWLGGALLSWPLAVALPAGVALAAFLATRINALNVQVHEGSHGALAADRRRNEWLTNWAAAYWIGLDADGYRRIHSRHHQQLNEAGDPDRPLYELEPRRAALAGALLRDLTGVSLLRRALAYRRESQRAGPGEAGASLRHLAGKGLTNAALLGSQVALHGAAAGLAVYGLFWVVPLFCLYPVIIRLRIVAEHFDPAIMAPDAGAAAFVARTSECSWLEHYLLGAQMDYHFEHHLFPGIPYANLRRLHDALRAAGFFEKSRCVEPARALSGGYLHFWRNLLAGEYLSRPARPGVADAY